LFEQLQLIRGLYARFILNINTASTQLTVSAGRANNNFSPLVNSVSQGSTVCSQGTVPFMVSSFESGQPNYQLCPLIATGSPTTYTFTCVNGIAGVQYTDAAGIARTIQHPQRAVRLWGPLITLSPTAEQQYLSLNPTRRIVYRDIYQYTVSKVTSGATFNNLLTNGVVDAKTLIIVPIFSNTSNGSSSFSPLQSVFSTEPGTTSPLCAITNFNVQLAGVNLYQANLLYSWQNFIEELNGANSINGNLVTGLGSSLINEYSYSYLYGYNVTNLSRRISSEDLVPKSIQILGQSLSGQTVDLLCFVEIEKELLLDLASGARLQ